MAKAKKEIIRDESVKVKHYSGGEWKSRFFAKKGKRSFTASKRARIYVAVPPVTGWVGGDPEKNGYKRKAG